MAYTVKQLANLSGVSIRTLHWYDEIDLLKPSYHGANGYRYYEEKQLLMLQQILFLRELGLHLNDIPTLLSQDPLEQIKTLQSHKQTLTCQIKRKNDLVSTIDKTISHLSGTKVMNDNELYKGFIGAKEKEDDQQKQPNDYD